MTAPADLRCMGLLMRCRTSTRCRLYESHPGPCLYNALYDTGEGVENIADRVGIREDANACLSEETGDRQCVRPVGHGGMHSVVPWTEDRPDEEPEEHGTPTETGATDRQGRCTVPEPPPGPDGRCGACGRQFSAEDSRHGSRARRRWTCRRSAR